jgi:prepilin-type N-terminal cleavage/methylation domain-containing protein
VKNRVEKLKILCRRWFINPGHKALHRESGFTLVEVIAAVFILAVVGSIGVVSLTTATKSRVQTDVRTTAVSLTDTIMENVKVNAGLTKYQFASGSYARYSVLKSSLPADYQVWTLDSNATPRNDSDTLNYYVYGLPCNVTTGQADSTDAGIQKVTIIIQYNNQEIYRLADFKVNR